MDLTKDGVINPEEWLTLVHRNPGALAPRCTALQGLRACSCPPAGVQDRSQHLCNPHPRVHPSCPPHTDVISFMTLPVLDELVARFPIPRKPGPAGPRIAG